MSSVFIQLREGIAYVRSNHNAGDYGSLVL